MTICTHNRAAEPVAILRALALAAVALLVLVAGQARADADAEIDRQLLPLFAQLPSDPDLAKVKAAIEASGRNDTATAESIAAEIVDPTARRLVQWFELRSAGPGTTPEAVHEFVKANPGWPEGSLAARAEEALLSGGTAEQIFAYLDKTKPRTGAGEAAQAIAWLERGDLVKAQKLAAEMWRSAELSAEEEDAVLARLGRVLSQDDHKWRFDNIMYSDSRWANIRAVRAAAAKRLVPLLAPQDQAKAAFRLAVYRCTAGGCLGAAKQAYAKLPAEAQKDWGVVYHRVQMLRRSGALKQAWTTLLGAPSDPALAISLDDWWVERRVNIYNALYGGDRQAAYKLAAAHGPVSVNPLKEAEFLAGWIALRFLKDAKRAAGHFAAMRKAADGPVSASQADYWLGRAQAALGDRAAADQSYASAGAGFHTYYGQLARQTLEKQASPLPIPPVPVPDQATADRFVAQGAVKAATIAAKAGLPEVARIFFIDWRDKLRKEPELVLAAHLAKTLGDTQMAVKLGKIAMEKGLVGLTAYAYPIHAMPAFEPLRSLPEEAIFYAIARQESEFNTMITSGAGARGILQVMPATARSICRQYKLKCGGAKSLDDPVLNARLATAYIADSRDGFDGSYVMAIAGYNAGPGRVREWVGKIGDPRSPSVDPIDWIELISIEETRDYVKKVLSNIQVYRARLGNEQTALQLRADLLRARGSNKQLTASD